MRGVFEMTEGVKGLITGVFEMTEDGCVDRRSVRDDKGEIALLHNVFEMTKYLAPPFSTIENAACLMLYISESLP